MEPQNQIIKKGMPPWLSIVLIIVIAGLATGGTWYLMDQKVKKNDDKVTTLQGQVDKLTKGTAKVTPTPISTITSTPTVATDVTANWKTYTSSKYQYSFKYPSDWSVKTENISQSSNGEERVTITPSGSTETNYHQIVISGTRDGFSFTIPEWTNNFTLGGTQAYKKSLAGGQNPPQELVYAKKNSTYVIVQYVYLNNDYMTTYNQLLETFRI